MIEAATSGAGVRAPGAAMPASPNRQNGVREPGYRTDFGMAGDWIPIRTDIHSVPEVLRLARLTGRPVDEVVGLLVRFWAWAQAHTDDGYLAGVDLEDAASGSHVPSRFVGALAEVHWLVCDPGEGLRLPNFGRWMSGSAKARLREREKKRRQRREARGPPCPDSVPMMSRCDRDTIGTTGEDRRGQNTAASAAAPPPPRENAGGRPWIGPR